MELEREGYQEDARDTIWVLDKITGRLIEVEVEDDAGDD